MLIMFVSLDRAFHPLSFYKGDEIYYPHSTAGKGGKEEESNSSSSHDEVGLEEGGADNDPEPGSMPWAPRSLRQIVIPGLNVVGFFPYNDLISRN